ncbi:MAG: lysine--tRNA ligase [Candidatus Bathyarchaeota archaeon]|nr:MAG: lysine--tRNA ligase [Candidatus Bathyarchaeota archaeon]
MAKRKIYYKHWIDEEADALANLNRSSYIINTGMAISGLIHIGKCRSDLLCPGALSIKLRSLCKDVKHYLTLYTQDPFKAKPPLVKPDFAEKYRGIRILDVPCPKGCCGSWVDHFLNPFKSTLDNFKIHPIMIATDQMYQKPKMKMIIRKIMRKREEVRRIANRYRGEAKKPHGWIPFNPLCNKCHAISPQFTEALSLDLDNWTVEYRCKKCNDHGVSGMELGKLDWRLEWAAIWLFLDVDFEPFGKDHAMAGGSRESCSAIAREVLGFEPPRGQPFEFVSLLVDGRSIEMTSSGGVSFDFDEWPRVAEPEVLKYWYMIMKPMKHLEFSPSRIPYLVNEYDRAEAAYFNIQEPQDPQIALAMKRSYELAHNEAPPTEMPIQVPYDHAAMISQLVADLSDHDAVLEALRRTIAIPGKASEKSTNYVLERIRRAYCWATEYAPTRYRIKMLPRMPEDVKHQLGEKDLAALASLADSLEAQEWTPADLKAEIYRIARDVIKMSPKRFFQVIYLVFFGQKSGPQLAQFISSLDKESVITRLRKL